MTINTLEALQYTDIDGNPVENPILGLIETLSIAWFVAEYLLRFAGSPEKVKFAKDVMNVIDVISILPFFVDLFLLGGDPEDSDPTAEPGSGPTVPSYLLSTAEAPGEEVEDEE